MRSRLSRGFSRLAMVIATPLCILGIATAAMELKWQSETASSLDPAAVHHADFTVAAILVLASFTAYGLARGFGWVLDGFLAAARHSQA